MSEPDPNKNNDSPRSARQKANKSVRWTGQDYFSYAGASGNREHRAGSSHQGYTSNDSDSSETSSDDEEERGSHSASVRAATRANTWFNRLRQEEDDDRMLSVDDDDDDETQHLQAPRPSNRRTNSMEAQMPTIQVSQHDVNPYEHILDIGTHTSAGLGPGGRELNTDGDNDPLDREYRERRNRLLASVGRSSEPSSPDLHPVDPMNTGAVPLQPLRLSQTYEEEEQSDGEPSDRPAPRTQERSRSNAGPSVLPFDPNQLPEYEQEDPSTRTEELPDRFHSDNADHNEAEALKQRLQHSQSERTHKYERVIAARHRTESMTSGHQSHHSHHSHHSGRSRSESHGSHSGSHSGSHGHHRTSSDGTHADSGSTASRESKKADAEEQLRKLEETARLEAEEHAKNLVKTHLATNLLKPNANNDGYVHNAGFLQKAGSLDDDLSLIEDSEHEGADDAQEGAEKKGDKRDGSTSSNDTLQAEKEASKDQDSSDSGSDSEDERRGVSLRGDPDYVPPPKKVKEGVLGSLLRLYAGQEDDAKSTTSTISPGTSPAVTPSSTPLHSPPLPSPGGTPSEYSPSMAGESGAGTSVAPSEDYLSAPGSTGDKRWKRPGYFRTHSSEDALGRESKGRPKWYKRPSSSNTPSLGQLASSGLAVAGSAASTAASSAAHHAHAPHFHRKSMRPSHISGEFVDAAGKVERRGYDEIAALREKEAKKKQKKEQQAKREKEKALKKARLAEQARITVHIADVLQRQRFLLRLGRALMLFGAPSHRLEEYLKSTARVLEIDAQVLYIPGCILVSFGDATTHTSETKLIRVAQGLNLAKLHSTHLIYKEVVHDLMSLEEASSHIDHLLRSNNVYPWWLVVLFYGTACACCGMFAYNAYWKDIPIIFVLGGFVGFLQFWVQPKSDLYANVFEVTSSILVSFIGRAFGSIMDGHDSYVFCFASIVQASLALILPGYIILVGALELQTKNLVAGSVRMFYANIYSLFLSFGITLGSAIFGWCYNGAVTETTCNRTVNAKWKILFVPAATLFMALVNQAGYRQLPVMVLIGSAGYTVQYFVERQVNAAAFTSAIGAFTMGVVGNLYSRVGHGLAFAAMLPGIFVLVPSGVAAQGSLVAGVKVATEIVNSSKSNGTRTKDNSTQTISDLGNSMTQVAVGIAVGLFAATLVVYPLGLTKKRSGLFTF